MRLLFDAHQLGRRQTGNETYVRGLLGEFRRHPDLAVTAAVERPALADPLVAPPVVRRRVPAGGLRRLAVLGIAARTGTFDVVHAVYFAPPALGRPLVLTVHDISYELHPEFFSRTDRWRNRLLIRDAARRARVVVTVSETSRRDLLERYGLREERVVAIPNGVAPSLLAGPPAVIEPVNDRPVRVLAVGTLQPRKNLGRLLQAIRRAARVRPVALRVVGPDGFGADAIRADLAGVADVEILGFVDDAALAAEYRAADMLVYPSLYEGFGLPVAEAMACGLPVITSTGGALPEVAGDAAVILDPLDVEGMSDAILALAEDTERRRALGAAGRARAAGFTWAAAAERHVAVYRAAVDG